MAKPIGVLCPRGTILNSECERCALTAERPCHLTPDILHLMRNESRTLPPRTYTATQLLTCDRQDVLMAGRSDGYFIDIEGAWKMLRGTMVHNTMEKLPAFPGVVDVIREVRLATPIRTRYGSFMFAGKFDMLSVNRVEDGVGFCTLYDYKTVSTIEHSKVAASDEHVMQLNMYAWLIETALAETIVVQRPDLSGPVLSFVVERVEVFYGDMKKTRVFNSSPGRTAKGKMLTRTNPTYESIDLAAIPLLAPADVRSWIAARIEEKEEAKQVMPSMIEEDRRWMCINCPVKVPCSRIGEHS